MDPELRACIASIYEEVMWLAARPNVTPGRARAWYTHVMAESVKRRLRRFTGQISVRASVDSGEQLMLEHYLRIQTTLTNLVQRHRDSGVHDLAEFEGVMLEYEQVHIVTRSENYAAQRAKGDYLAAGIDLVNWADLPFPRQHELWTRMLRGRVANAEIFRPNA